jgi:hypothetical protein
MKTQEQRSASGNATTQRIANSNFCQLIPIAPELGLIMGLIGVGDAKANDLFVVLFVSRVRVCLELGAYKV